MIVFYPVTGYLAAIGMATGCVTHFLYFEILRKSISQFF
jgi:hypothetical protein